VIPNREDPRGEQHLFKWLSAACRQATSVAQRVESARTPLTDPKPSVATFQVRTFAAHASYVGKRTHHYVQARCLAHIIAHIEDERESACGGWGGGARGYKDGEDAETHLCSRPSLIACSCAQGKPMAFVVWQTMLKWRQTFHWMARFGSTLGWPPDAFHDCR